jgi:hypothetical protein
MNRPEYWKHLAEEHGDCLCWFIKEPAIREELSYQQAAIAAHFGRLYLEWLDEQTQEVVA